MIRVIINADDFGKSEDVNAEILKAIDSGRITSTTIMANTVLWNDIHSIIDANPQVSYGVHLNLTEGNALTNSKVLYDFGIVDKNNIFIGEIRYVKSFTQELLSAIYDELDEQINTIVGKEKIRISHFDGHHHIHTLFPIRHVIKQLANKYGVTKIRNRYKKPQNLRNRIIYSLFHILSKIPGTFGICCFLSDKSVNFRKICSVMSDYIWRDDIKECMRFTDYFDSYESFLNIVNSGLIIEDNSTIELMCHPGHKNYEREFELVMENSLCGKLEDITRINYNNL